MSYAKRTGRSRHRGLRTVDVARQVGCSVQHLRDLEREGVMPAAARAPSGYRTWSQVHVWSAVAYRDLSQGVGPTRARHLLQALHREPQELFLALLDEAHADLACERRDLQLARQAVVDIAAEPLAAPRPSDDMTISELAQALATTPATLRHWETEGLLNAHRTGRGQVRTYSPTQVRDTRVIHQLRAAGYRIPQLGTVLRSLTTHQHGDGTVDAGLALRAKQLTARSHALLRAAAALHQVMGDDTQSTATREPATDPPVGRGR